MTMPVDCTVAYAIPTSRVRFEWSLHQTHSDYAKGFAGGWYQYREICVEIYEAMQTYRKFGVRRIAQEVCSSQWPQLLFESDVILLFAHWFGPEDKGAVEFWDGPLAVDRMVSEIPFDFKGVIDLSVCHPFGLADKIGRERPNCSAFYAECEVNPNIWAQMYSSTFELLSLTDMPYKEAVMRVALEYRKQSSKGRSSGKSIRKCQ
ncbi:hypothetical protein [Acidobacterium sp. S8]|uniref:hypothetical protein n=1 Tax=Acidobacterium sp. S8 TaxID=1641854 RepID=UPI00131D927E|nr:hypothetical protein [Acidobacterium sp. S8]